MQEYLKFKKTGGGQHNSGLAGTDNPFAFGEFTRELIICSHQSLRLGDAVYWLYNLNMHSANSASLVLTDPYTADDPLLLKPF